MTVVFSYSGYHIYLMNLLHILSLTLFDDHVWDTCHTMWKVPTPGVRVEYLLSLI